MITSKFRKILPWALATSKNSLPRNKPEHKTQPEPLQCSVPGSQDQSSIVKSNIAFPEKKSVASKSTNASSSANSSELPICILGSVWSMGSKETTTPDEVPLLDVDRSQDDVTTQSVASVFKVNASQQTDEGYSDSEISTDETIVSRPDVDSSVDNVTTQSAAYYTSVSKVNASQQTEDEPPGAETNIDEDASTGTSTFEDKGCMADLETTCYSENSCNTEQATEEVGNEIRIEFLSNVSERDHISHRETDTSNELHNSSVPVLLTSHSDRQEYHKKASTKGSPETSKIRGSLPDLVQSSLKTASSKNVDSEFVSNQVDTGNRDSNESCTPKVQNQSKLSEENKNEAQARDWVKSFWNNVVCPDAPSLRETIADENVSGSNLFPNWNPQKGEKALNNAPLNDTQSGTTSSVPPRCAKKTISRKKCTTKINVLLKALEENPSDWRSKRSDQLRTYSKPDSKNNRTFFITKCTENESQESSVHCKPSSPNSISRSKKVRKEKDVCNVTAIVEGHLASEEMKCSALNNSSSVESIVGRQKTGKASVKCGTKTKRHTKHQKLGTLNKETATSDVDNAVHKEGTKRSTDCKQKTPEKNKLTQPLLKHCSSRNPNVNTESAVRPTQYPGDSKQHKKENATNTFPSNVKKHGSTSNDKKSHSVDTKNDYQNLKFANLQLAASTSKEGSSLLGNTSKEQEDYHSRNKQRFKLEDEIAGSDTETSIELDGASSSDESDNTEVYISESDNTEVYESDSNESDSSSSSSSSASELKNFLIHKAEKSLQKFVSSTSLLKSVASSVSSNEIGKPKQKPNVGKSSETRTPTKQETDPYLSIIIKPCSVRLNRLDPSAIHHKNYELISQHQKKKRKSGNDVEGKLLLHVIKSFMKKENKKCVRKKEKELEQKLQRICSSLLDEEEREKRRRPCKLKTQSGSGKNTSHRTEASHGRVPKRNYVVGSSDDFPSHFRKQSKTEDKSHPHKLRNSLEEKYADLQKRFEETNKLLSIYKEQLY